MAAGHHRFAVTPVAGCVGRCVYVIPTPLLIESQKLIPDLLEMRQWNKSYHYKINNYFLLFMLYLFLIFTAYF